MAFLDDHPPARSQFRYPRRADPSGVAVVHTAENTPDWVAFDGGAEAVANFIRNRPDAGSYHDLADSDSDINLVRYDAEAFHDGTGSNPHSYGVSAATRADVWQLAPEEWRVRCVRNMARCAARWAKWLHATHGIVVPARRITRAQSDAGIPGFISHAERDPARRTDPGKWFPWVLFLAEYARFMAGTPAADPNMEDDMPLIFAAPQRPAALLSGSEMCPFADADPTLANLTAAGVPVVPVSPGDYDRFLADFSNDDAGLIKKLARVEQLMGQVGMYTAASAQVLGRMEQAGATPAE